VGRSKKRQLDNGRNVNLPSKLSAWKQKIVAFAGALGAPGLFLISFLDSSVLTFPVINDLLLIELSIQHPLRMPLYALMAMSGSVLGCVVLYFLARAGGEAFFHKKAGARGRAIRHWVETNGFGGVLIAAMLPPPTPFKIFVFAAGVFEVPFISFVVAVSLARAIRYFTMGYLAVKYGDQALPFLAQHKLQVTVAVIIFAAVSYGLSRLILREREIERKVEIGK
jgi:membrane protein YqaA with SNARE-associated domain